MAYSVTNYDGAFNDIGLVDVYIYTPMGTIKAQNLGPSDVAIIARPGNGGDVMNFQEGSMGQLLANKSYKVKNWGLDISFLRHSLDYCRGTYLIQEILNGHITSVGIKLVNKNFGGGAVASNEHGTSNETLSSDCAFLVNFPGIEAGAGTNGDFTLTFKLSNATYVSGSYSVWANNYDDVHKIPGNKLKVAFDGTTYTNTGETLTDIGGVSTETEVEETPAEGD